MFVRSEVLMATGLALAVAVAAAPAAEPSPPGNSAPAEKTPSAEELLSKIPEELRTADLEDMVRAIATRKMGPGQGWYKPGQSRFGWEWLKSRHDTDGSGDIDASEFTAPDAFFKRLDRDGNGKIAPDDFDWTDESPYMKRAAQTEQLFRRLDRGSDGRIDRDEWLAAFERLSPEKEDGITSDDLRELLFPPMGRGERPSPEVLLAGLISGEIGSHRPGPMVGDEAPDFELRTQDGKQVVRLSQFRGDKPVVLIFGSFT